MPTRSDAKYCDADCRKAAWSERPRVHVAGELRSEPLPHTGASWWRSCEACAQLLPSSARADARTCSARCRVARHRGAPLYSLAELHVGTARCCGTMVWAFRAPVDEPGLARCLSCGRYQLAWAPARGWESSAEDDTTASSADVDVPAGRAPLLRPLLKWPGGKARLVPAIEAAFGEPCRGRHIEPFVGSGAVFLGRRAAGTVRSAILADVNPKLIGFHQAVRDRVDDLLEELRRLPGRDGWRDRYGELRAAFNAGPHVGPVHAARLLWLNRACFNGLYRENRAGEFNAPPGDELGELPGEGHVRQVSRLLQDAELRVADFPETMRLARRGDQVYADPPYVPTSATSFVAYAGAFGLERHVELAELTRAAAATGVRCITSSPALELTRGPLLGPDRGVVAGVSASRSIGRTVASRAAGDELLTA